MMHYLWIRAWTALLLLLTTSINTTQALDVRDDAQKTNASVLIYNGGEDNITFALTAAQSNGDLYFHMSAPTGYGWFGVGIGSAMKGALMFIIYQGSNGGTVTLSPRRSSGHSEPTYQSSINASLVTDSTLGPSSIQSFNGTDYLIANVHCQGCLKLSDPPLDLISKTQPFIFALGGGESPQSDAKDAGIRRHEYYAGFTMDMTVATVTNAADAGVPKGNVLLQQTGVTFDNNSLKHDKGDLASAFHAVLMCGAFVIAFPLGSICMRVLGWVKIHAGVQTLAMIVVVVGSGVGIYLSGMYNKSKSYSSVHQILGILVFAGVIIQFALGITHHLQYKRTQLPTLMGRIHKYLGPAIIFVGIVNAFIGFPFAENARKDIPLALIVLAMAVVVLTAFWLKKRRGAKKVANPSTGVPPADSGQPGVPAPYPSQYGPQSTPWGEPPPRYADASRSDVALSTMNSRQEDGYYGQQPHQPRPLV